MLKNLYNKIFLVKYKINYYYIRIKSYLIREKIENFIKNIL